MATGGVWHVRHCCPLFFASAALPAICPVCRQHLDVAALAVPLPSPFRPSVDHPRSVLLRPTVGQFQDYRGGDLHVGVSDASGQVVAFDADGLRRCAASQWTQCLVIPLRPGAGADVSDRSANTNAAEGTKDTVNEGVTSEALDASPSEVFWDEAIKSFISSDEWSPESYHETTRNCFSFLLAFLDRAGVLSSPVPWTRERFAEQHVLPVTRRAAKYLTLERRVVRDGWCALGEQAKRGN